jgi:hypothetical protein
MKSVQTTIRAVACAALAAAVACAFESEGAVQDLNESGSTADAELGASDDASSTSGSESGVTQIQETKDISTSDVGNESVDATTETTSDVGTASSDDHATTIADEPTCIESCCNAHPGPSCADADVTACACAYNDGMGTHGGACCSSVWGEYCVAVAQRFCGLDCGGCR